MRLHLLDVVRFLIAVFVYDRRLYVGCPLLVITMLIGCVICVECVILLAVLCCCCLQVGSGCVHVWLDRLWCATDHVGVDRVVFCECQTFLFCWDFCCCQPRCLWIVLPSEQ